MIKYKPIINLVDIQYAPTVYERKAIILTIVLDMVERGDSKETIAEITNLLMDLPYIPIEQRHLGR